MPVSGRFLLVCSFPALQIPNLKSPAPTYQRDLTFEPGFFAKLFRQNEAALSVRRRMLRTRMQLP